MNQFLEIINPAYDRSNFKACVFDFDGTISLIREGWQQVMIPYFTDELIGAVGMDPRNAKDIVTGFVDYLTGKQTIYQCIRLAEVIRENGGTSKEPQEYKDEYHDRLMFRINYRIEALKNKESDPLDMVVPGSFALLDMLKSRGISMYLASGTDEKYVLEEAVLLGVHKYFDGGIYGAKDDYRSFSKAMVINNIITTNKLHGTELLGFGDGYVEIENIKEAGGFAIGVASDEKNRSGIDQWKRGRLIKAGADMIIPDYSDTGILEKYIFQGVTDHAI